MDVRSSRKFPGVPMFTAASAKAFSGITDSSTSPDILIDILWILYYNSNFAPHKIYMHGYDLGE